MNKKRWTFYDWTDYHFENVRDDEDQEPYMVQTWVQHNMFSTKLVISNDALKRGVLQLADPESSPEPEKGEPSRKAPFRGQ